MKEIKHKNQREGGWEGVRDKREKTFLGGDDMVGGGRDPAEK